MNADKRLSSNQQTTSYKLSRSLTPLHSQNNNLRVRPLRPTILQPTRQPRRHLRDLRHRPRDIPTIRRDLSRHDDFRSSAAEDMEGKVPAISREMRLLRLDVAFDAVQEGVDCGGQEG